MQNEQTSLLGAGAHSRENAPTTGTGTGSPISNDYDPTTVPSTSSCGTTPISVLPAGEGLTVAGDVDDFAVKAKQQKARGSSVILSIGTANNDYNDGNALDSIEEPVSPLTGGGPIPCVRCGATCKKGRTFMFPVMVDGQRKRHPKCGTCAIRHLPMIRRSFVVACIVGTILIMINLGDFIFRGELMPSMRWKIPLTYCVPFSVATYGALSNVRQ